MVRQPPVGRHGALAVRPEQHRRSRRRRGSTSTPESPPRARANSNRLCSAAPTCRAQHRRRPSLGDTGPVPRSRRWDDITEQRTAATLGLGPESVAGVATEGCRRYPSQLRVRRSPAAARSASRVTPHGQHASRCSPPGGLKVSSPRRTLEPTRHPLRQAVSSFSRSHRTSIAARRRHERWLGRGSRRFTSAVIWEEQAALAGAAGSCRSDPLFQRDG